MIQRKKRKQRSGKTVICSISMTPALRDRVKAELGGGSLSKGVTRACKIALWV